MQIEMTVKTLMIDPATNLPIVILRDKDGSRVLPIWVGVAEANAIALQIENVATPRPMARWMPNITLGLFGLAALVWRARYTEGGLPLRVPDAVRRRFDSWRQGRQMAAPAGDSKRAPRPGKRPVVVIRIPHLSVPAPRLIDRYISRVYLRIVGLSFM